MSTAQAFEVVCEIEPATTPDMRRVRHQIGVLSAVSSTFLVPDNHIGRATVSSIAVAREVVEMGGRAIACLNARDRNVLGFRRDLLTATAYGVSELLFVYGDRPESVRRSDDLRVKAMISAARGFSERYGPGRHGFRIGVTSRLAPLPDWTTEAEFLFVQARFSVERLLEWRASVEFGGPVYAGVLVLASAQMARKLATSVPQLTVPAPVIDRLEGDGSAGVKIGCQMVCEIRGSGAFQGVHLIPVRRYREVASRLEDLL